MPGITGQRRRQHRPLHRLHDVALRVQAGVLDRDRGAVGGELEQVVLLVGEVPAASSVPTCSTPITRPSTSSGTPSSERMPFSRRIGLRMSAWSTSSIATDWRSAAIRPAKPRPTGTRTPCSTSSSMPLAACATRSPDTSSRSRNAAVSLPRIAAMRSSSSLSSSGIDSEASAASLIRWSSRRATSGEGVGRPPMAASYERARARTTSTPGAPRGGGRARRGPAGGRGL